MYQQDIMDMYDPGIMALIAGLLTIVIILVIGFCILSIFFGVGMWIVRPLDLPGKSRQSTNKFSIADFLSLFVTVQLPLSSLVLFRGGTQEENAIRIIILVLAWVVGPFIWWTAAKAISRAGIHHGWQRITLMAVVIPVVYYCLFPFSIAVMPCIFGLSSVAFGYINFDIRWAISLTVFPGCALLLCGVVTRKIVATLEEERKELTADEHDSGTIIL